MTYHLGMSKERSQVQIPRAKTKATEIPSLQSPLNEERNKKREREATTPISGPTEQPGENRQSLNPILEEELIEEPTDSLIGERATSRQTPPLRGTSTSSQK